MLNKGKHVYKYIADGNWIINQDAWSEKEEDGTLNNYIEV